MAFNLMKALVYVALLIQESHTKIPFVKGTVPFGTKNQSEEEGAISYIMSLCMCIMPIYCDLRGVQQMLAVQ